MSKKILSITIIILIGLFFGVTSADALSFGSLIRPFELIKDPIKPAAQTCLPPEEITGDGYPIDQDITLCGDREYIHFPRTTHFFIADGNGTAEDNIVFDCDGATILNPPNDPSAFSAFYLDGHEYITITNCNIENFSEHTIELTSSNNNTFSNITQNSGNVYLSSSSSNVFDNFEYSDINGNIFNYMDLNNSNYNKILNSTFYGSSINPINDIAIDMWNSNYNEIKNIEIIDTYYGIYSYQSDSPEIDNNTFSGNFVGIFLENNTNTNQKQIINNNITNNSYGIYSYLSENLEIINNTITESDVGILLDAGSNSNSLVNNAISNISDKGIWLLESDNSQIYDNTISGSDVGILLDAGSNSNSLVNNAISNISDSGIWIQGDLNNILTTDYNNISDNIINNAYYGIAMGWGASNNNFNNNTITASSSTSIYIYGGFSSINILRNNSFYYNNIIGSEITGIDILHETENTYFEGNYIKDTNGPGMIIMEYNDDVSLTENHFENNLYTIYNKSESTEFDVNGKGNYWSDYDEVDEGCVDINAEGQVDGVCNSPYTNPNENPASDGFVQDNFPLTEFPSLFPIEPINVNELNNVIINMTAIDPQGDELTYSIDDSRFGSLAACWPGTNAFIWVPNEYGAGSYIFDAVVSDGTFEVRQSVPVIVNNTCQLNKWGRMICTSHHENLACY